MYIIKLIFGIRCEIIFLSSFFCAAGFFLLFLSVLCFSMVDFVGSFSMKNTSKLDS